MRYKPFIFLLAAIYILVLLNSAVLYAQDLKNETTKDSIPSKEAPIAAETSSVVVDSDKGIKENKISLDLKGLDVVDVLKIISMRSGLNIVIGKNVTGRVTMFLKDVNIWDAFEIIIASNNLAYDKKDNIINVMTDKEYEFIYGERFSDRKQLLMKELKYAKAQDVSKSLVQIKSNIGRIVIDEGTNTLVILDTLEKIAQMSPVIENLDKPIETKVFELKYANAEKVSGKILEALTKGIGTMRTDERTNKIAITDYPGRIGEVSKLIEAFDEKPRQVRIDAEIIEISPEKDEFKMGIDWDAWISKNIRIANSLPLGNLAKLSLGSATGSLAVSEKFDRKGIIDLLRTIGKTKILSSPTIMALNNQEAKILVGTKEAYITSTTSQGGTGTQVTAQEVNFVDVGIKLYVTPTINKDGLVIMKIKPEVSSSKLTDLTSEGKITQVPIVTTSEAETTVGVKDGSTIVIAGLKKDKKEKEIKKIPLFGDIPILGLAFRSYSSTLTKTELVIFLTPHIIADDAPPKYVSLTDDDDIQRFAKKDETAKSELLANEEKIAKPIEKESSNADIRKKGRKPSLSRNRKISKKKLEDRERKTTTSIPPVVKPKADSKESIPAQSEPKQIVNNAKDYANYLRDKILSVINSMPGRAELKGEVLVSFSILADGQLSGEPRIISLTSERLKEPVINAVKSASPFPKFPEDLKKLQERFQLAILYD